MITDEMFAELTARVVQLERLVEGLLEVRRPDDGVHPMPLAPNDETFHFAPEAPMI